MSHGDRAYRQRATTQVGFTLVELLVVAVVLAIFAAIVIPNFGNATDEAKVSAALSDLSRIRTGIELYRQQHGGTLPGVATSASAACVQPGVSGLGGPRTDLAFIYQLSLFTDEKGGSCSVASSTFKFGPYATAKDVPKNPYTGNNAIRVIGLGEVQPKGAAATSRGGWLYDYVSGRFVMDHEDYDHL